MSEERLEEIKDSIEFQKSIIPHSENDVFLQEEVDLYDEVVRLNNIINELDEDIYSLYEDICNSDDTYSYRIPIEIIIDRLVKMTSKIAKFKENEELKDSDNNVKKINTNNN